MVRRSIIFSALLVALVVLSAAPVTAQTSGKQKCVIFRDDDVGLGHPIETLKAVNQVHVDEGVPITLGIVPHPYGGLPNQTALDDTAQSSLIVQQAYTNANNELLSKNPAFLDYMRSITANPLFEFAQHGYTHQKNGLSDRSYDTGEFAREPYDVQYKTIREGRNNIKEAFGITPSTFIPPWDRGDINTLKALRELGFTEYCSGGTDMKTLYGRLDGIRVEPVSFDIYGSSYAELNKSINTARDRIDQFSSDPYNDTFVVGYHYWTFSGPTTAADLTKVQLLQDFIKYAKSHRNISFTKLDRSGTIQPQVTQASAENEATTPPPEPVMTNPLENVSNGVTNVAVGVGPFCTLAVFIVGVGLVGPYLYARRGGGTSTRPIATSPATTEKHTSAEDPTDVITAQRSGWDQEMLHDHGVVIPTDGLSQPLTPSGHQPANADAEPSASASIDKES